jgi:CubicO group peptidase (beta-lactamase class C family)
VDLLDVVSRPTRRFKALCRIPRHLAGVISVGDEEPGASGVGEEDTAAVWRRVETLYRTGLYPALQICIRHRGRVVLDRALGHARGNAPSDVPDAPKIPATTKTPFCAYSASKPATAMLIHKLDEGGVLHIGDRVSDYLPEFRRNGKDGITIAHLLSHRAGIPSVPPGAMQLELLSDPDAIVELLCNAELVTRPGRHLAYHAITGGFVLAEVVRRATGKDIRTVFAEAVQEPLRLRWTNFGVAAEEVAYVAQDAATGFPPVALLSRLFHRALGTGLRDVVALATDPRFLTGIVPSANLITTARELSRFYQCLLDAGAAEGIRIFEPRTVRRATVEQSYWEIDLTLGIPLRHGLGFMLGAQALSPFGPDTPQAFGHVGFTNIFSWADPERELSVALLTSGKPFLDVQMLCLYALLREIGRRFPKRASRQAPRRKGHTSEVPLPRRRRGAERSKRASRRRAR